MSKLDNVILECINKALDGKQEKYGDYVDPTKQQIKELFLELIGEDIDLRPLEPLSNIQRTALGRNIEKSLLRQKVGRL